MKNVNLTGIFLAMVESFGVNSFNLTSIVPEGGEPIDALITFDGGDFNWFDLEDAANKCEAVENIVKANLTGEVLQIRTSIKNSKLELYIEFENSKFLDDLD